MKPESVFYVRFPREDCDALLAEGIEDYFVVDTGATVDWEALNTWLTAQRDWVFGWVGYDVRRSVERFATEHITPSTFPQLLLVRPKNLFKLKGDSIEVVKGEWSSELDCWLDMAPLGASDGIELKPLVTREDYDQQFASLMHEIAVGNVYELNYCLPFEAHTRLNDPIATWKKIYARTQAPFATFARFNQFHVLCASPERYLKRLGNEVVSQPIKGTVRRGSTPLEDEQLKLELVRSKKERAENVMIVDLVRNDLSRCAIRGSVQVEELFGVHSFKTVHHLVSTIRCTVQEDTSWVDLIRATFPMGSMTGAPKVSAMNLISSHESTERGIYSGSIGYIEPNGDFDFNVVIRSLQYDEASAHVSCHVGGAITALCNAEAEYNECLLKVEAVLSALRG